MYTYISIAVILISTTTIYKSIATISFKLISSTRSVFSFKLKKRSHSAHTPYPYRQKEFANNPHLFQHYKTSAKSSGIISLGLLSVNEGARVVYFKRVFERIAMARVSQKTFLYETIQFLAISNLFITEPGI